MKTLSTTYAAAGLLGLALATTAVAQQTDFPAERTRTASCDAVNWNKEMLQHHPGLINACQEVVIVEGETWARFAAKFVRVRPDGNVIFSMLDRRDRSIEELMVVPTEGQVAYINDRPTPLRELRTSDSISLYVPEGRYGFATRPGVPPEQLARVVDPEPETITAAAAPATTNVLVAQRDTRPPVLPATASSLPWLAVAGVLSLLGGVVLTLRRWS
jgi:LPXTG-motif cell wall-anchored protein